MPRGQYPQVKSSTYYKGGGKFGGRWIKVKHNMSKLALAFQTSITGTTQEWIQNGVKFDGIRNGRLLETKGKYAQFVNETTGEFYKWFQGRESSVYQAIRQLRALNGMPVDWYFMEELTMKCNKTAFYKRGISGINLF